MQATTNNQHPTSNNELLSFDCLEKSFFGVRVLKQISFSIGVGRIVGLVGENGAGKSTLMNVLGGNLEPDAGRMRLTVPMTAPSPLTGERGGTVRSHSHCADAPGTHPSPLTTPPVEGPKGPAVGVAKRVEYSPRTPRDARVAGIGFVHQELNLFTNLSIAENLFVTNFPTTGPIIRRAELHRRTTRLLQRVGLDLSPDTLIERLSSGERQLVEIAHALSFDARLIIFDEPTTSLSARECERLFTLMRQLRDEGRSLIFISHTLGDVLRLCDEIVVLRDGEVVAKGAAAEFSPSRLVTLMVGRELTRLFPERRRGIAAGGTGDGEGRGEPKTRADGESQRRLEVPLLEVRHISQPGIVRDISFTLHRGEVLGISGLMGAGRTELARILFGLDPHRAGGIELEGTAVTGSPRGRMKRGLALLTENRRHDGLCLEASVADNMALVTLARRTQTPARLIDFDGVRTALTRIREAVRLQGSVQLEQPVQTLSGGNQQKVVLAKWLLTDPKVLILDEPTRGIDVGAKLEIYQLILELADRGSGVLLISSEIEELIGLCDRILVLSRGRIAGEFPRAEFNRERILQAALAGHEPREVEA